MPFNLLIGVYFMARIMDKLAKSSFVSKWDVELYANEDANGVIDNSICIVFGVNDSIINSDRQGKVEGDIKEECKNLGYDIVAYKWEHSNPEALHIEVK